MRQQQRRRGKGEETIFEKFTDRARRVIVLAQTEARDLDHDYIGTEHLLLGVLAEGQGVAFKALQDLGVSLAEVRGEVEQIVGKGLRPAPGHLPFTPRAKKVLRLSLRQSLQLDNDYIGTEHLLLGLLAEGEGVAAQVLRGRDVDLAHVHRATIERLSELTEPEHRRPPRQPVDFSAPISDRPPIDPVTDSVADLSDGEHARLMIAHYTRVLNDFNAAEARKARLAAEAEQQQVWETENAALGAQEGEAHVQRQQLADLIQQAEAMRTQLEAALASSTSWTAYLRDMLDGHS